MTRRYRLYHAAYSNGGFCYMMIDVEELKASNPEDYFARIDDLEELADEGIYEIEGDDPGMLDSSFCVGTSF